MATLTVWMFDSPGGAGSLATRLDTLAKAGMLEVVDGAVVEWPESSRHPRTTQLRHGVERALGASLGVGRLRGGGDRTDESLRLAGLDDDGVKRVRGTVSPGTSALVLFTAKTDQASLVDALGGPMTRARLIHSNLPDQDETELRRRLLAD
jgi:uncharacterized membrane protein